jgi:hypothetical protein
MHIWRPARFAAGNPHPTRSGRRRHARIAPARFLESGSGAARRRFDTALLLLPTETRRVMLFWAGIPPHRRAASSTRLLMESVSRHKYVPLRHEADYCLDLGRRIGVQRRSGDRSIVSGRARASPLR